MIGLFAQLFNHIEILLFSALPVIELRGAIPMGLALGMSLQAAFMISYIGSLLPSLPILLFYSLLSRKLSPYPPFDRVFSWISKRLNKHRSEIERYGYIGLLIFVAIPLPGTGVWTGSGIAAILGLSKLKSFIAIAVGNLIAGLLITALSYPLWATERVLITCEYMFSPAVAMVTLLW